MRSMILFVNRFYIITTGRQQESQGRVRGCCQGWREGPPGKANEKFLEKPGKANEKFLEFSVNQCLPDQRRALPETETPVTNDQITVDVTNPPFPPQRKQKEYRIHLIVQYAYSSEINITKTNVQSLLSAANLLQVSEFGGRGRAAEKKNKR